MQRPLILMADHNILAMHSLSKWVSSDAGFDYAMPTVNCSTCIVMTIAVSVLVQVRAAVPMYLLARKIKAKGFKVVLSGEGADEIFGGYLYFHKAPSPAEFHKCAHLVSFLGCRVLHPGILVLVLRIDMT